tara:strand:+ start:423 stop:641 length:219 start_codon:yes stop_codon:yes gene_type:complete
LLNAQVALEFIEAQRPILGQRDDNKNTPLVADTGQDFMDTFAIWALVVVRHLSQDLRAQAKLKMLDGLEYQW